MGIFDFLKKKQDAPTNEAVKKPENTTDAKRTGAPAPVAAPAPAAVPEKPKEEAKQVTAPAVVEGRKIKYHYDRVRVFTPKELDVDFPKLSPGDTVTLIPDPKNPYDPNAVRVAHRLYQTAGYLNKGKIYEMANDYLKAGCPVYAHIDSIDDDRGAMTLFMAFYGSPRDDRSPSFKLTGSGSGKAQEAILCAGEGDSLEVEYDDEKEKYAVYSMGNFVGYLPAAAEEYGESADRCTVKKIATNDSGKSEVYVYFE